MSRKDYEAIARQFKGTIGTYSRDSQLNPRYVLKDMALAMCEVLKADNPLFKADKFMQACGFNEVIAVKDGNNFV